jgi:UDP-glucose 4-epimerase
MPKILITGGSGFIGKHLVKGLNAESYDKKDGQDILDKDKLEEAVAGKDYVIHLAGMLGTHELIDNTYNAAMVNIIGTLNVLEACKKHKVKLIEVSKPNVWVNTYSITKDCCEKFTEMYRIEHGLKAVIVKWFNVYGPGQPLMEEAGYQKAIPTWIVAGLKGEPIEIYGNGYQTVDLVHTDDIVDSTKAIIDNFDKCEGQTFEIGKDEIELNIVAEKIRDLTGNSEIRHVKMRKGETENTRIKADISKIYKYTGWKPKMDLTKGLKLTINAYVHALAS